MPGTLEEPEFRLAGIRLTSRTVAGLIEGTIRLVGKTLRVEVIDRAGFFRGDHAGEYIFAFWHNRLFVMPLAFRMWCGHRKGAVGLASASRDGTLLSHILERIGIRTVRGSSSRRGSAATLALIKEMREGYDAMITPDGPRGPRYRLNPGVIFLAAKTGQPILFLQVEFSRCVRLRTWDRFIIPLPFSRVIFTSLPLYFVPPTEDAKELETHRARLEELAAPHTR